tara:strand:- start:112 stop:390 length:279 start_codon:yes stop_codon:yes gene_type:complete
MNKRITVKVELESAIDDRAFELDDFVDDLMWAVKEYINDRIEGFSDWNQQAIKGMHDKKSFIWANSVVDSLERTRDSVDYTVEDIEYAEVEP